MNDRLSDALLRQLDVSRESKARLEAYVDLLLRWQTKINLVGPSTVGQVWHRHILDSLQLLPLLPRQTRVIADLGSGAGLPGIVLAIARPVDVHLFESNGKKAAFLREAVRQTDAKATIHQIRLETIRSLPVRPKVQVVTARALAPLPTLLDYAQCWLEEGAVGLFHKGQDIDTELTKATKYWKICCQKHPSMTDSAGVILEIKEAHRDHS